MLRPGTKHKFRFEYTPINYDAETVLRLTFIFNGIRFPVAIPVETELTWKAYRFGYEWDFVYMDRGFVGLLLEPKYTDVEARLSNVLDARVRSRACAESRPSASSAAATSSPTSRSPASSASSSCRTDIDEDYQGKYFDFDLYGTVNFTDHFGAQVGYRSFDVFYKIDDDDGDLNLKGLYFGGVARF